MFLSTPSEVCLSLYLCITSTPLVYSDVFQSLSPHLPFGIVPQENSTNGSVVETYNSLRNSSIGHDNFIRGYTALAVTHCLIVRHGVKLEDIEHVLSHEQVSMTHHSKSMPGLNPISRLWVSVDHSWHNICLGHP